MTTERSAEGRGAIRMAYRRFPGIDERDLPKRTENEPEHRVTYFDQTDWQTGGKNPFREAIEERAKHLNSTMRLIDIP